jgi:hypothetical protein
LSLEECEEGTNPKCLDSLTILPGPLTGQELRSSILRKLIRHCTQLLDVISQNLLYTFGTLSVLRCESGQESAGGEQNNRTNITVTT